MVELAFHNCSLYNILAFISCSDCFGKCIMVCKELKVKDQSWNGIYLPCRTVYVTTVLYASTLLYMCTVCEKIFTWHPIRNGMTRTIKWRSTPESEEKAVKRIFNVHSMSNWLFEGFLGEFSNVFAAFLFLYEEYSTQKSGLKKYIALHP